MLFRSSLAPLSRPGEDSALTELTHPEIDWVSLARGYGVPGTRIESAEALMEALPRALAEPGPSLLELVI